MVTALITVRASSTRLQRKCFLPFGSYCVLEHVIRRCQEFCFDPVVSTTIDDNEIVELCETLGVKCFQGSNEDKLDRWLGTCEKFKIDKFVTVDCDDPFFDRNLAELAYHSAGTKVVKSGKNKTLDVFAPDMEAYLGSAGWGITHDALKKICATKKSNETEMIWKHFPDHDFISIGVPSDARPIEYNLRLTLDYEEDYWLLRTVLRELGPFCDRRQITDFFEANPGLRLVNQFRNVEWKQKQNA